MRNVQKCVVEAVCSLDCVVVCGTGVNHNVANTRLVAVGLLHNNETCSFRVQVNFNE